MTVGGSSYGGSAYGSTETTDTGATSTATATTTATTTAVGDGEATSTATATTIATTTAVGVGSATSTASVGTVASTTTISIAETTSTASVVSTANSRVVDAEGRNLPIDWQVTRNGTEIEDAVFDVDPVVDTANPFGDYCVIKIDDSGGEKFETYGRGTRVDVGVSENSGITFDNRFTGYVVERRETEQSGADVLEVEAYSFDQFLRRNTVTNDQRGHTISEALADIIQTDTPVTFNAALVDVGDDQELTRTYQGEAVETVLRDLAFKSNNEDFGVNDDLEFFFRERETTHIDRGINNTQWFNYDIPELGKEAINEVEVWFDDGEESVIVDDGTDKLDLQDSLGLGDPGTQRAELNRPLLTDINDAEDEGRKFLEFKNATLSGTVTTFGLFDAKPGDTIDVEIAPRGIDDEFVIAAIEYRWGVDETILTIVEKRGDVDDILSELNESVQRVEMEGANRDAPKNRITTTEAAAVVNVDVTPEPDGVRFVNDGRRAVRDAWTGDAPPDITTLAVGSDGSGLSRSNGSLRDQTNSASVTQTLPDSTSVQFEATITQSDVQEIGLLAADGTMIARATFDTPVDIDGTVGVTLAVSNDGSVSRGVLTTTGQTAVRDALADNGPEIPTDYAYGGDGAEVAETDTTLGEELVEVSLDEILIQSASTDAEFEQITDTSITDPIAVQNGALEHLQECFHLDARTDTVDSERSFNDLDDNFTDGVAALLSVEGNFLEYQITPEYTIDAANFGFQFRISAESTSNQDLRITVNGTRIHEGPNISVNSDIVPSLDWYGMGFFTGPRGVELPAGEPATVLIEVVDREAGAQTNIDRVAVYDTRFESQLDFDNTVDDEQQLSGPQFFANSVEQEFATVTTRRNVTEAAINATWDDVSNGQYQELAIIDDTFERTNNSETATISVADEDADTSVQSRVSLSRYGTATTDTPTEGRQGQRIESWELTANPDAVVSDAISSALTRGIVPPDTLDDGTTIREAGIKSTGDLLTRHQLADFPVLSGQRVSSSETTRFTGDN